MNKVYKKYVALAASAILGVSALVGCSAAAPTIGTITGGAKSVAAQEVLTATDSAASGETTAASASADATGDYSKKDLNTDYDAASAVTIALNGDSIAAEGQGVATDGSTVTISAAGTYILSGSLTDGQIIVNAKDMDDVQLVLDGVDLYCSTSAPIYVKNADKVILTLAKGSQNTVKDSDNYTYADAAAEEPDAAIFSKVDLSINGSGSLTVEGSFNDALGTKDDLTITGGTIDVTAVGKGLHGRDSISVLDGDITVSAGGDGMQSNNDEDTTKGWIILDGGTFHITAGNDAIQAETALTVNGGTFNLTSGGGSANAEQRSQDAGFGGRGQVAQPAATDATATESYKGMK
ncbi:MAG TPA: dockerin type 1, partial [Clostridiales bacterium]|nr:dockerin type 1 [Clostridiales bacterium]